MQRGSCEAASGEQGSFSAGFPRERFAYEVREHEDAHAGRLADVVIACFCPIRAWQLEDGKVVFVERGAVARELELPCGQCSGCRVERSREWAVRCVHEASLHEHSVFVTLTYSDQHLRSLSLVYKDFQDFMKRLRRRRSVFDVQLWQYVPRFYAAGEYGEAFERPHFHALLFGVFFEDRQYVKSLRSGFRLYSSEELSSLWPWGFSSIGDVTFESAAYVARYVMKKVTGHAAEQHYEFVDIGSGEISQRRPEFNRMSLKPGIGAGWYQRFGKEVFPEDYVVMNGVKMSPPKYYDKLLERQDAGLLEEVEYSRFLRSSRQEFEGENSPERLAVRRDVHEARLQFKRRSIK